MNRGVFVLGGRGEYWGGECSLEAIFRYSDAGVVHMLVGADCITTEDLKFTVRKRTTQ